MIYEVQNLKFSYDKPTQTGGKTGGYVLDGISLGINRGELLCVLGRNGSGKSTLFSCLLGLQKNYEGSIKLNGKEVKTMKETEIAKVSGFVPQSTDAQFSFTVFDYVLMGCAASVGLFDHPGEKEKKSAWNALELMEITDFADREITSLSGGERQQIAIARAIVSNPSVILFDEPTAHLDYSNQVKVLRMIKDLSKMGFAIAVTTHDPNHAILLDGNVALFDGAGHVEFGSAEEMITEEKLNGIYGSDLKIRYVEEFNRNVCIYPAL